MKEIEKEHNILNVLSINDLCDFVLRSQQIDKRKAKKIVQKIRTIESNTHANIERGVDDKLVFKSLNEDILEAPEFDSDELRRKISDSLHLYATIKLADKLAEIQQKEMDDIMKEAEEKWPK